MAEPTDDIPDFATLAADPEIAPLLGFEPVARQVKRPNGWTPGLQRELIARLAATGTLQQAVWQMGKPLKLATAHSSPILKAAINAPCGMLTDPALRPVSTPC